MVLVRSVSCFAFQIYSPYSGGRSVQENEKVARSTKTVTLALGICNDRGMPYEPVSGPVRPFFEDRNFYQFRFFCDSDRRVLIEKTLPKSTPSHVCRCGAVISFERDGEGPYLRFSTRPESHLAARKRG